MPRDTAKHYAELAEACFREGYNCAQATGAPFAEALGLPRDLVLRGLAGFGGGIGGLRQTCGAVSAMAFVAGLHGEALAPGDLAAKTALYDTIKRMRGEFVARHGSDCCRELLERAGVVPAADPSARSEAYYAERPCAALVASAAEIIARTLGEDGSGF